jgi:signal transduction histidine kinase
METTASLINPATTSKKEQDRILNHLLGAHPAFRQLILLNTEGQKFLTISRRSREVSGRIKEGYMDELLSQTGQGKKYISPVYVDDVTSEPMILVALPIKDVFGDEQGMLTAEVNLKFMWDLVEGMKVGRTGQAYVVDRQGKLIAFGDISRVLRGESVENLKIVSEFIKNPLPGAEARAILYKGITGKTVIGTYVSLEVPDWAVVTEIPAAEAYSIVTRTILTIVLFSILISIIAGWIGIYLARQLSRPLVSLMKTCARIAGGEMDLRAEVGGPAEISSLAEAFNSMTSRLQEVIGHLEQHGHYLQQQDEKLRIYSDRLRKSNKELEQFAYVASHDLQEPLRKIKFFGDRLKKNYSGSLDEKALEYIDRMNGAVKRMEDFIKDLLEYSRIATNARPFEPVDLDTVIKEVLSDLEIRINETKAEIKLENLPAIDADRLQMRQLFQNIIGNAIKYHREEVPPVIYINSKTVNKEGHDFYEIIITDNGIGFDNKYADQIFGLFQRLHGRSEYDGTGIGLALCKKIVEQHNGFITASGKEGEGSTFKILLPVKQKENL